MATEVLLKRSCDVCVAANTVDGVDVKTWQLGNDEHGELEADICDDCVGAASLSDIISVARPVKKQRTKKDDASDRTCPLCNEVKNTRTSLAGHLRDKHGLTMTQAGISKRQPKEQPKKATRKRK